MPPTIERAANPVGDPAFFAQLFVEPGGELTSQDQVQDQDVLVGRVGPGESQMTGPHDRLGSAGPVEEEETWSGGSKVLRKRSRDGFSTAPGREPAVHLARQTVRIDVAGDHDRRGAGDQETFMKLHQIGPGKCGDAGLCSGKRKSERVVFTVKGRQQGPMRA